jgi:hypothetical protein
MFLKISEVHFLTKLYSFIPPVAHLNLVRQPLNHLFSPLCPVNPPRLDQPPVGQQPQAGHQRLSQDLHGGGAGGRTVPTHRGRQAPLGSYPWQRTVQPPQKCVPFRLNDEWKYIKAEKRNIDDGKIR